MKKDLINKLGLNCLIDENKKTLTPEEKYKVVEKLNQTYSYAQISVITGIPKSTISTWVMRGKPTTEQKDPKRMNIYELIEYFENLEPNIDEWGLLEKLKHTLDELLKPKVSK